MRNKSSNPGDAMPYRGIARRFLERLKSVHKEGIWRRVLEDGTLITVGHMAGQDFIDIMVPKPSTDQQIFKSYMESGLIDVGNPYLDGAGLVYYDGSILQTDHLQKQIPIDPASEFFNRPQDDLPSPIESEAHTKKDQPLVLGTGSLEYKAAPILAPPSMWTGKMRQFMQARYALKEDDVRRPQVSVYLGTPSVRVDSKLVGYRFADSSGIIESNGYIFFATVSSQTLYIYETSLTENGKLIKTFLDEPALTDAETSELETRLLQETLLTGTLLHTVDLSDCYTKGEPFYFGWKFSASGMRLAVVVNQIKPGESQTGMSLSANYRYESTIFTVELTHSVDESDPGNIVHTWGDSVTEDGPHGWLVHPGHTYIWYPLPAASSHIVFSPYRLVSDAAKNQAMSYTFADVPIYGAFQGEEFIPVTADWPKPPAGGAGGFIPGYSANHTCDPTTYERRWESTKNSAMGPYGFTYGEAEAKVTYFIRATLAIRAGKKAGNIIEGTWQPGNWNAGAYYWCHDVNDWDGSLPLHAAVACCDQDKCTPSGANAHFFWKIDRIGPVYGLNTTYLPNTSTSSRVIMVIPWDDAELVQLGAQQSSAGRLTWNYYKQSTMIHSGEVAPRCVQCGLNSDRPITACEEAGKLDVILYPPWGAYTTAGTDHSYMEPSSNLKASGTTNVNSASLTVQVVGPGNAPETVYESKQHSQSGSSLPTEYNIFGISDLLSDAIRTSGADIGGVFNWRGWETYFSPPYLTDPLAHSRVLAQQSAIDRAVVSYRSPNYGYEYISDEYTDLRDGDELIVSSNIFWGGRA